MQLVLFSGGLLFSFLVHFFFDDLLDGDVRFLCPQLHDATHTFCFSRSALAIQPISNPEATTQWHDGPVCLPTTAHVLIRREDFINKQMSTSRANRGTARPERRLRRKRERLHSGVYDGGGRPWLRRIEPSGDVGNDEKKRAKQSANEVPLLVEADVCDLYGERQDHQQVVKVLYSESFKGQSQ